MKKEIKKVKFSDWHIKKRRGISVGLSETICWREKVKCRKVKVVADMRVEEGIILEYEQKERGSKEPYNKEHNQHLVGYRYVSLIDAKDRDVFWFQKCGNSYRFFYDGCSGGIKDFVSYQDAWDEFNKLLREKWGVEVLY